MDNIIKIINIEDEDILVVDSFIEDNTKFLVIQKKLTEHYCPSCNSIMHSKGFYQRKVNHSMLQDGFKLMIILNQRKFRCTNPDCNTYKNEEFTFVQAYKRQSNLIPFMIMNALKDPHITLAQAARAFNISDTEVHKIFMSYIDVKRLPLPEILVIDEVFLDIDYKTKFACVLLDFKTGEIVDILPNRWKTTLDKYFSSIPREEKDNVKFLISDMYDTYINLKNDYLPNAVGIIDSFHVLSNLESKLNTYLNSVKRRYQEKDKKELEEKNKNNNTNYKTKKKSKELNVLNNYSFFLLKDKDDIEYRQGTHYNRDVKYYASTWDLEKEFMKLDPQFPILSELKQKYINFNKTRFDDMEEVEVKFNDLIKEYKDSGNAIFIEFARLLERYRTPILASFNYIEISNEEWVRLSSGIIEGFNRLPKDMKREARGFEVFEYIKARLIYANRKFVPIRVIPKNDLEIPKSNKKYRQRKNKDNK